MNALTDEEAARMLEKLERHFGEPVMPVGKYCAALRLWRSALADGAERLRKGGEGCSSLEDAEKLLHAVDFVFLQISKSNLLHRLIYAGESLRTEPCPIHKGRWFGCAWDDSPCDCQRMQGGGHGANITGWLP